jgi:folate-binding protein YgfZ
MNQWHAFLTSHGAVITENGVSHFGDLQSELSAAANSNVLADLSHLSLLRLSGEDAFTFLQGQVTNDVRQLDGSNSQYAGYCTPKGRLLALFLAYAHDENLFLQLDNRIAEAIAKRLRMYVLRSKVAIEDISADTVRLGVAGKDAEAALKALFPALPAEAHAIANNEHGTLIRLPGPTPRYELVTDAAQAQAGKLWEQLSGQLKPVGKLAWEWLEIQAGIPDIQPGAQEEFVPQMVNLDALNGISFKKGCYTGQEIVARTHYLGKVKRRTQLAHLAGETEPGPGDDVTAGTGGEPVGKIVRSAPSPLGGFDMLVEVRLESLQSTLLWQGVELEIKPLPYGLD